MDITDVRRANLATWVKAHGVPTAEKSFFSQLKKPETSFGEKVARRLESDYGMEPGSLDRTDVEAVDEQAAIFEVADLISLFGKADRDGRNTIMDTARAAVALATATRGRRVVDKQQ
jgi:hypothetical protein